MFHFIVLPTQIGAKKLCFKQMNPVAAKKNDENFFCAFENLPPGEKKSDSAKQTFILFVQIGVPKYQMAAFFPRLPVERLSL